MNVLVIDVGGSKVKCLVAGEARARRFDSGPGLTPETMVERVKQLVADWDYDVIALGFPGPVEQNAIAREPHNLGTGWVGFDLEKAFGRPVRLINDAAMQALGSYDGGHMLFLGLGTGLGSAMVVDGVVHPLELAHLPWRGKRTYEDILGERGLDRLGRKRWRRAVREVLVLLKTALLPDYIVVGGGNARKLKKLPPFARPGRNANAFRGGFMLWQRDTPNPAPPPVPEA